MAPLRNPLPLLAPALLALLLCTTPTHANQDDDDNTDYLGFHLVATMPYKLSDHTATTFNSAFGDDKGPRIYLVGGCVADQLCNYIDKTVDDSLFCYCPEITSKCVYFNPETDEYTACADAPTERYRHMAAKVGDYLYLAGGRDLADGLITTVDRYNTLTDTWDTPYTWADASSDGAAFAVADLLYLVGGYDIFYSNILTTLTGIDTTVAGSAAITPYADMAVGRGDIAAIELDGEFYVVGGWTGDWCTPSNVTEIYTPSTDTWRSVEALFDPRGDLALGTMDGMIFAVGGEKKKSGDASCSYSVPVDLVERYRVDAWNGEEDIPADLFRFSGASYNSSYNDARYKTGIYLFGGQGVYEKGAKTGADAGIFPVRDSTIKYVPTSTGHSSKDLSDGGIAGIVIAAVVVAGFIALAAAFYCARQRYIKLEDTDTGAEMGHVAVTVADMEGGKLDDEEEIKFR